MEKNGVGSERKSDSATFSCACPISRLISISRRGIWYY